MQKVTNAVANVLVGKPGLNLTGAEVLEVRGRKSGQPHRIPVQPVTVHGARYLYSPRDEIDWVRNIRVPGEARLHRGTKSTAILVQEVTAAHLKVPVIRTCLDRWGSQVGHLENLPKQASDTDILAIADWYPVFRINS